MASRNSRLRMAQAPIGQFPRVDYTLIMRVLPYPLLDIGPITAMFDEHGSGSLALNDRPVTRTILRVWCRVGLTPATPVDAARLHMFDQGGRREFEHVHYAA